MFFLPLYSRSTKPIYAEKVDIIAYRNLEPNPTYYFVLLENEREGWEGNALRAWLACPFATHGTAYLLYIYILVFP